MYDNPARNHATIVFDRIINDMKLTSLFFLTTTVFFIGACSQDNDTAAGAAAEKADSEKVAEMTNEVTNTFTTAALIDPNTASADVMAGIPGISDELAQQIISGRPYATPTALHAVLKDAVDKSELRAIYSAMFVKVDLNNGSNADYQLIPTSLSPRKLAHEEYRPYESIEQFSREMSKYVSAEEVAFLTRYVTIN